MSAEAKKALVKATVENGRGYIPILQVQAFVPTLTVQRLLADFGGLHDYGFVTLTGYGQSAFVRWEGLIVFGPEGRVYYVQDANRHIAGSVEQALREGMEAVLCE